MSKERTSVSLEPEVAQYLQRDSVNASGLVNELVDQHMTAGSTEKQLVQFRIGQVESEVESLEARLERKRKELSTLKDREESLEEESKRSEEEALENLKPRDFEYESQKVNYWAGELGMTVDEFIDEYQDRV